MKMKYIVVILIYCCVFVVRYACVIVGYCWFGIVYIVGYVLLVSFFFFFLLSIASYLLYCWSLIARICVQ